MKNLNRANTGKVEKPPIKVVQFGEGNFLRAFVDYAFQKLNEEANFNAGIAIVQPIERGQIKILNGQDGLYTLFMKGIKNGKEIQDIELISNIVKGVDPFEDYDAFLSLAREEELAFIISNTTEAGIAYVQSDKHEMRPPSSFPAKLTVLLVERFNFFKGDISKGLTIIPCELINYNADTLKEIILQYADDWNLGDDFKSWLHDHNSFHNTLVDRIVPGYPKDDINSYNKQLEYADNLIVTAEVFFLWVIEGGDDLKSKLPFQSTDLDVKIVKDMQPYRTRKVRILNGAHTALVPFSLMYGNSTVKESVDNAFTGAFINSAIYDEVIPTLNMDQDELKLFAAEVMDRFRNPFIKHQLADIALNSISKFKVRVLPSLLDYVSSQNRIPTHLTFAFACLLRFYKGTWREAQLPVKDSKEVLEHFKKIWTLKDTSKIVDSILSNKEYWDIDLTKIKGISEAIVFALEEIESNGIEKGFANFSSRY